MLYYKLITQVNISICAIFIKNENLSYERKFTQYRLRKKNFHIIKPQFNSLFYSPLLNLIITISVSNFYHTNAITNYPQYYYTTHY